MNLNPLKMPEGVEVHTTPITPPIRYNAYNKHGGLVGSREGVSVFAEAPGAIVRIDVLDSPFNLLNRLRQRKAALRAAKLALK